MGLIDADLLQTALMDEYVGIAGHNTRTQFYRAIEIVQQQPNIIPPPSGPPSNAALTLEELREMDGEPVWVIFYAAYMETAGMWALVSVEGYTKEVFLTNRLGGRSTYDEAVVNVKAIYRRKPEEGTKWTK